MAQPTIVNRFGRVIGWNNITVNILGRDVEGIKSIEYNDNVEKESVYGAGKMPVGTGEGNYSATCSLELMEEERRAIMAALPPGTRIQDVPPFSIEVSYEYQNTVYKDRIHNCEFKNNGVEASQNDKELSFDFELHTSHISWNI